MTSRITFVWCVAAAASMTGSLAGADAAPRLPDQYAEAVLDVEGMI